MLSEEEELIIKKRENSYFHVTHYNTYQINMYVQDKFDWKGF